jgi:two-component system, NtrC family, nitrogen regulation response regulator GlnG
MRKSAGSYGFQSLAAPELKQFCQKRFCVRGNFLGEKMAAVWIVDDDESIRWVLERALTRQGFDVRAFSGASDCLDALRLGTPNALVSDIRMPGENGLDLLKRIKTQYPKVPVIIMTAYSDLDSAVSALQGGAFEYLPKPFDVSDAVDLITRAVAETQTSVALPSSEVGAEEILGQAPAMQEVFRAIGRLSNSNATVLITGESGTGKELVARALHDHSNRSKKMFVALNTAAIPRDLLESELFGHERGAFTGAQQSRVGRFEQAEGGTLFLDEIGDMPSELQTRLLRILSDGQYYRVGGQQPLRANVRVIAATHQDLEDRVRQGLFREDLFHRLHVIRLRLPSLRERREDIPLLARHFLQKSARSLGGDAKRLGDDALAAMAAFAWPGNVRQLENVCHWLTVMAPSISVGVADLPPELRTSGLRAPVPVTLAAASGGFSEPAAALARLDPRVEPRVDSNTGFNAVTSAVTANLSGTASNLTSGAAAKSERSANVILDDHERLADIDLSGALAPNGRVHAANGLHGTQFVPGVHSSAVQGRATGTGPGESGATGASQLQWSSLLEREVASLLNAQPHDQRLTGASELMDELTRVFESTIIKTTLQHTRGRRIEAALRLGIGRNTITRKIQDLHIEE